MKTFFTLLSAILLMAQPTLAQFTLTQTLDQKLKDKKTVSELYFVGNGDIQAGLTNQKKELAANTGLGILFWRIWDGSWELQLDAKVNVASTIDTIMHERINGVVSNNRLYGRSVLIPGFSKQSTIIDMLWYRDEKAGPFWRVFNGMQLKAAASNNVWGYYDQVPQIRGNDTMMVRRNNFIDVSNLAIRAGVFHEFVEQELRRKNSNSVRLGLNVIMRSIQGDIGLKTSANDQMRRDFLLSDRTIHFGLEPTLTFRLKNIRAEAALPYLFVRDSNAIPGLSGAQFVTSISFVGGFPVKME